MYLASAAQGLYIEYLTFDGNRWNFGSAPSTGFSTPPNLSCLQANQYGFDLDLESATIATVWQDNFINAPDGALRLGGSAYTTNPNSVSTVDYSNFAENTTSYATRSTGILLEGYAGAYYNYVYYSGTAAINFSNSSSATNVGPIAYGNQLTNNRYELSDGFGGGGQLYVDSSASYVQAATNIIDGAFWFTAPSTTTVNGCPLNAGGVFQSPVGVEAYGNNNSYYNNEIYHHATTGMQFGNSDGLTYNVDISGTNPYDSSDTAHYIHDNYFNGLWFLGSSYSNGVSGVTIDNIRICNNGYSSAPSTPHYFAAPYGDNGIAFGYTSGTGFTNGLTMSNNYPSNFGGSYSFTNGPGAPSSCPQPVP